MQPKIKAIETRYAGCHFRSRLEARWAVAFDQLNLAWEYEPQGYELPSGSRYLPDFWLPDVRWHVEVKGSEDAFIAEGTRYAEAICARALPGNGLIVLGPVPDPTKAHLFYTLVNDVSDDGDDVICAHLIDLCEPGALAGRRLGYCTDIQATTGLPILTDPFSSWTAGRSYSHLDFQLHTQAANAFVAARSARFEHGRSGA